MHAKICSESQIFAKLVVYAQKIRTTPSYEMVLFRFKSLEQLKREPIQSRWFMETDRTDHNLLWPYTGCVQDYDLSYAHQGVRTRKYRPPAHRIVLVNAPFAIKYLSIFHIALPPNPMHTPCIPLLLGSSCNHAAVFLEIVETASNSMRLLTLHS